VATSGVAICPCSFLVQELVTILLVNFQILPGVSHSAAFQAISPFTNMFKRSLTTLKEDATGK